MSVGQMSVGQMSVGQMSVGQMSVSQMSVDQGLPAKCLWAKCLSAKCLSAQWFLTKRHGPDYFVVVSSNLSTSLLVRVAPTLPTTKYQTFVLRHWRSNRNKLECSGPANSFQVNLIFVRMVNKLTHSVGYLRGSLLVYARVLYSKILDKLPLKTLYHTYLHTDMHA